MPGLLSYHISISVHRRSRPAGAACHDTLWPATLFIQTVASGTQKKS